MAEKVHYRSERKLLRHTTAFLCSSDDRRVVQSALTQWNHKNWKPFLFGGMLRDLLIFGGRATPRDIDVVIANGTSEEIEESLGPYIRRRNRFGGFQLQVCNWLFDVWPLEKTWAFVKSQTLSPSPANLPKTTFLNVEAIAISVDEKGRVVELFECGFFEAIRTRIIDINFLENPFPELAAVRSIITAKKLNYGLSPQLSTYVLNQVRIVGVKSLIEAQIQHYGDIRVQRPELESIVTHIRQALDSRPTLPVWIPGTTPYSPRIERSNRLEQNQVQSH